MSREQRPDVGGAQERTVKTAGRIVKYSREIYHLESVEEVANLTLEATPHFIDGHPTPTVCEIRDGDLRPLASMEFDRTEGETVDSLAKTAYESGAVTVSAGPETKLAYTDEEMHVVEPEAYEGYSEGSVTIAAPTVYTDEVGDSGAVLLVRWSTLPTVEMYHVKPVDYLAEHVATAIVNIRSHERLELARNDLAKRKEMLEVYDKLLRHDLGNDLQVINGFSEAALGVIDEENPAYGHIEKVNRTGKNAADLIETVGKTVKTLQEADETERKQLQTVLREVVENVETKFGHLTVNYQPEGFDEEVYAGDLIESVFANIISNAAVHNDGEVTVQITTAGGAPDYLTVIIADDGEGIDKGIEEELFEMGKKGRGSDGTGLGLGLARTLVESYGGSISVTESEHGGAQFAIKLRKA